MNNREKKVDGVQPRIIIRKVLSIKMAKTAKDDFFFFPTTSSNSVGDFEEKAHQSRRRASLLLFSREIFMVKRKEKSSISETASFSRKNIFQGGYIIITIRFDIVREA